MLSKKENANKLCDLQKKGKYPIWTTDFIEPIDDCFLFSFDKETIFNFWEDYPNKLTKEQISIFKKAFPVWANLKPDNLI